MPVSQPRLFRLGETDFGMEEQMLQYTSGEARGMGLLVLDDILADFERVLSNDKRREAAAKKQQAEPQAAASTATNNNVQRCHTAAVDTPEVDTVEVVAPSEATATVEDPAASHDGAPIQAIKRTFQPSTVRRKRKFGFLARLADKDGRKVLQRRRAKGRARLAG